MLRHSGRRSTIHRLIVVVDVLVRDVGPRDGLQAEAPLPVVQRAELAERLIDAGLQHVEVASFVRDDLVPAMAGAEDVVALVSARPHVTRYGLVANLRGAQRGAATTLEAFTFTLSLSQEYSLKNTRRNLGESLKVLADVVSAVGRPVDAVISCAFGSPFDDVDVIRDLPKLVTEVRRCGAADITLADTTGMATPRIIDEVLQLVGSDIGIHLHETRGTALLNAYAALRLGVRRFDTSIGGIGGSPFAPNASGNLATESLVRLLHDERFATGASFDGLLATAGWLQDILGHDLPSPLLQLSTN
jgi:hydroxymethylglutaryl-CoA lyase